MSARLLMMLLALLLSACQSPKSARTDAYTCFQGDVNLRSSVHRTACIRKVRGKHKTEIDKLIAGLALEKSREQAREKLVAMGSKAVPILLKVAKNHNDEEVRKSAIQILGKIGDRRAVLPLVILLQEVHDSPLIVHLIQTLADFRDERAVSPLLKFLDDKKLRCTAALALGKIGSPRAIPIMCKHLSTAPTPYKKCLTIALGELKAEQALPMLLEQFSLHEQELYSVTLEALAKLGSPKAIPHILATLNSKKPEFYLQAILILGDLKAKSALPVLNKALEDPRYYIRSGAIRSLGKIGSVESIPALYTIAQNPKSDLASEAIKAMREIPHPQTVHLLLDLATNHADSFLRWQAEQSLLQMKKQAIPLLIEELTSKENAIVVEKILALMGKDVVAPLLDAYPSQPQKQQPFLTIFGNVKAKRAVPLLLRVLDERPIIDERYILAVDALGKISSRKAIPKLREELKSTSSQKIRRSLILALSLSGDETIVADLVKYIEKADISSDFIHALGSFREKTVCKALLQLLQKSSQREINEAICQTLSRQISPRWEWNTDIHRIAKGKQLPIKIHVMGLLARLRDKKAYIWLRKMISDKDPLYRQLAVLEFSSLPPKLTVRHLLPLLEDPDAVIQVRVRETLRKVSGGKDFGEDLKMWKQWLRKSSKNRKSKKSF